MRNGEEKEHENNAEKIEFFVTPEIKRYVFVYLVDTGKTLVMIDSGVAGSEIHFTGETNCWLALKTYASLLIVGSTFGAMKVK